MLEYKEVKNFPGYKIGNDGSLLSSKRGKGYIKTFPNPEEYRFAYLYKDNKRHILAVHRLVAEHFVPNPNNYDCVNHKDENKENNLYTNLEWCTKSYNRKYGTCDERRFDALSPLYAVDQLDLDGNFIRKWRSCREAARALGLKNGTSICNCVHGRKNTSAGFKWRKSIK